MKTIPRETVCSAVKKLWVESAFELPEDITDRISQACREETLREAKEVLQLILENARLAREEKIPICQDTGFPIILLERGQELIIGEGELHEALERAVREGTSEGFLRGSVVNDPFTRENTGGNIPPVIHCETVPGEDLKITVAAKGAGSENMSCFSVLNPGEGKKGVKDFVIRHIRKAAINSCPPLVVGVGIGGTAEKAMLMAKKACFRKLDMPEGPNRELENELLSEINATGTGPGGFGGLTTALAVNIETFACHMASLPVAINLNCHAVRRKEILL